MSSVVTDHSARWEPRYASVGRSIRHRGSPVWARVDITVIDHVLDVLLDNALNYGAGTVTVSTNTRSESIEIDVADEGCGRATDPFGEQRSDSGHGIGLRLARTLAELAAGTLGPRQHLADGVPPDAAAAPLTVRPEAHAGSQTAIWSPTFSIFEKVGDQIDRSRRNAAKTFTQR